MINYNHLHVNCYLKATCNILVAADIPLNNFLANFEKINKLCPECKDRNLMIAKNDINKFCYYLMI